MVLVVEGSTKKWIDAENVPFSAYKTILLMIVVAISNSLFQKNLEKSSAVVSSTSHTRFNTWFSLVNSFILAFLKANEHAGK